MLDCKWMGIHLHSPIVLASLTLCSKPNIIKHIEYFKRAVEYGVGGIILPSIHPLRVNDTVGNPHVRATCIATGLASNNNMGFSILGTTDNIVSIEYGLLLAKESVKLGVPVIGSVANIGTESDFLYVIRELLSIHGLAGLELNFSCPNVMNGLDLNKQLLEKVRKACNDKFPVSVKLAPRSDYSFLLDNQKLFQGITLSNAYIGLVPPHISGDCFSPFGDMDKWRPTGIYGPQEKLLTYYDLWKFKTDERVSHLQLASVGGFVCADDVIQALMLGADCVQLSSAVFWNGLSIIQKCNEQIQSYLNNRLITIDELKGMAINYIVESDINLANQRPVRIFRVNHDKCNNCSNCACVERGCYAFDRYSNKCKPFIDNTLCSGCGWCKELCKFGAIDIY